MSGEADRIGEPGALPGRFRYHPNLLSADGEAALARELAALPFKPFDFHGYQANRQVVGFGCRGPVLASPLKSASARARRMP
jgi:hypothetical protein